MDNQTLTELLAGRLLIDIPPVGLRWLEAAPAGVTVLGKTPPSFCALWRLGERATFYAPAAEHKECLIGAHMAGFTLDADEMDEAYAMMADMCATEQVPSDNLGVLTRAPKQAAGILYGPLWTYPGTPDALVVWATLAQAGVLQELLGPLAWPGNPQGVTFGRPACGVVGAAMTAQKPALHEGCVGMRLYTQLPRELCPIGLPGELLGPLGDRLLALTDGPARIEAYLEKMRAATGQQGRG